MCLIILLEIVLKQDLSEIFCERQIIEKKSVEDALLKKYMDFEDKLNQEFFENLVQFVVKFCLVNGFCFDRMCKILKNVERFALGKNPLGLISEFFGIPQELIPEDEIKVKDVEVINLEEEVEENSHKEEFKVDCKEYELVSFIDELEGKIVFEI